MSRRLVAATVALLLAVLAAVLVLGYVARADDRAMADMSPTRVLVVNAPVPQGTSAEDLAEYVTVEELPAAAVVPGGVTSLDRVAGQLTTAPLQPGEQLLTSRLAPPEEADAGEIEVPEGYHELTIQLSPARVIGGHLEAGDTVGFFVSSEGETHIVLHKVLVVRVQGGVTVVEGEDGAERTQEAAATLMVTLALDVADAELVVNAAEFHAIWLSLEPPEAPESGTRVVDREELFG